MGLLDFLKSCNRQFEDAYYQKYGRALQREQREIDDFFMIITFAEMMGISNPFIFYTLDMMPQLMPKFHEWHKRMGVPHSHFDSFPCGGCC